MKDLIEFSTPKDSGMTLSEARNMVQEKIKEGVACPCCSQWVQKYRYSFHSGMVKALVYIYLAYENKEVKEGEFFHVEKYLKEKKVNFHGYHSKLKFWGLIEQQENDDFSKKYSGFWRITEKGRDFTQGNIALPMYAWLHNGELFGFEGKEVTIEQIKTKNFNYSEMMNAGR